MHDTQNPDDQNGPQSNRRTSENERPSGYRAILESLKPRASERSGRSVSLKTYDDLQWPEMMALLAAHCRCQPAAAMARKLRALGSDEQVARRLDEIGETQALLSSGESLGIVDMEDLHEALERATRGGVLDSLELKQAARSARLSDDVSSFIRSRADRLPLITEIADDLVPVGWLAAVIDDAIDDEGNLLDSASPELGGLRARARRIHKDVRKRLEALIHSNEYESLLQETYFTFRDNRYVLPIRSSDQSSVPGIVHGRSGSRQTTFIEPTELVELNNRLTYAELAVEREEERILTELSGQLANAAPDLRANMTRLFYLDLTMAAGRLCNELRATRPILARPESSSGLSAIDVRNARHPLLAIREARSDGAFAVVPNDIRFGSEKPAEADADAANPLDGQVLVISGPNTGGKTVTLKTLGLCALMLRAGLPLPVDEGSRFPVFRQVFADIGDDQDLAEDLSSFSGHVKQIMRILPALEHEQSHTGDMGSGALVLLDELFNGTDPQQGAALGAAILEEFAQLNATTAVTTHSEPLKQRALAAPGFVSASMGFDLKTSTPTYRLKLGLPGSSHALNIARSLGIPAQLIDRAHFLLGDRGQAEIEAVLTDLDTHRQRLLDQEQQLKAAQHAAEAEGRLYRQRLAKLKDEALASIDSGLRKSFDQLRDIEVLLKRRRRELTTERDQLNEAKLREIDRDMDSTRRKIAKKRVVRAREEALEIRTSLAIDDLRPGQEIWVMPFKRSGVVDRVLTDRKQVELRLGSIKTTVAIADCFGLTVKEAKTLRDGNTNGGRRQTAETTHQLPKRAIDPKNPDNTLDLRGFRVDEALDSLEQYLDRAYQRQLAGIYIVHGHGTGALKDAVRKHLRSSVYIRSQRPGERSEGGDGVTVAHIE